MSDTSTTHVKREKLDATIRALEEASCQAEGLELSTLEYIIKMALLEASEQLDQFD